MTGCSRSSSRACALLLAVGFVWAWLVWKGRPPRLHRASWGAGLLIGTVFAAEFLFLFLALDLTTVGRTSLIMYSMPVWFALLAHFGLGERITPTRAAGLALAFAGCAWRSCRGPTPARRAFWAIFARWVRPGAGR
jgi:drug/metabolite transporter (DMT)-like permease